MTRKLTACIIICLAVWGCRSQEMELNLTFEHLSGLVRQDRVLFEGNRIGNVQAVQYNSDGSYTVQVGIGTGFLHAVTQYSRFTIVEDPDRSDHKAVSVFLTKQGGTPLASGTTVAGVSAESELFSRLQRDLESGFYFFKEQIEKFERDIQQYPESEEYNNLKRSLQDLAVEIQQKEKQARERIKREWLPRIQRELDGLREKLKQHGREEELAPLEKEVERIRRI